MVKMEVADIHGGGAPARPRVIPLTASKAQVRVALKGDLLSESGSSTGAFSQAVCDKLVNALAGLLLTARQLDGVCGSPPPVEVQLSGVATQAFRESSNASQLIARVARELSLPVRVISQQEEVRTTL
jgi:exopolyphosphatase/pppGpp-phosphohydrolase